MRRRAVLILAAMFALAVVAAHGRAQPLQQPPVRDARSFSVTHYDVQLAPRLESRTVTGVATLSVVLHRDQVETIALARGRLEIDSVQEDGSARPFVVDGTRVRITLPRGRANRSRTLTIAYHGMPSSGLVFAPEREQFYTVFSTSQWMVAVDEPDARATLRLRLTIPRGWVSAASGREISRRDTSSSESLVEWQIDRPVPTYTFGFVAGAFSEASDRVSGVDLRYLGRGVSPSELQQIFTESARMIAFFEERSGVTYPGAAYTQVLVARTAGQEMTGLSIVSEDYGRAVLADSSAIGLIAHELAHQWWGNMVTCHAWTEFWLNEGFATFMAAAYRERLFGRETYLRDIEAMKARYEQIRARGNDRPLVFPNWDRPTADDRTLVYQKGGYVLHALRELIGDDAFWTGLRRYTIEHFGQSVTSDDLRAAMEAASGKDLRSFFDRWIYQ